MDRNIVKYKKLESYWPTGALRYLQALEAELLITGIQNSCIDGDHIILLICLWFGFYLEVKISVWTYVIVIILSLGMKT
jgi:hypothetical protein